MIGKAWDTADTAARSESETITYTDCSFSAAFATVMHELQSRADRRFTRRLRSRSVTHSGVSCRLAAVAARRWRS
jgi:hypothetical protein